MKRWMSEKDSAKSSQRDSVDLPYLRPLVNPPPPSPRNTIIFPEKPRIVLEAPQLRRQVSFYTEGIAKETDRPVRGFRPPVTLEALRAHSKKRRSASPLQPSFDAMRAHNSNAAVSSQVAPGDDDVTDYKKATAVYLSIANTNIRNFLPLFRSMRDAETGLEVRDRRWRLRVFENCFVGSSAVDWLANHLDITRSAAVKVGQRLLEAGAFHHVCREHEFEDDMLFYRWHVDEPSNYSMLNLRRAWYKSRFPDAVVVTVRLLQFLISICKRHQTLNEYRDVDIPGVQSDRSYQQFLVEVGELQAVSIANITSFEMRTALLLNLLTLLWLQARIHIGTLQKVDYSALEARAENFRYLVGGCSVSLHDISERLFGCKRSPALTPWEQDSFAEDKDAFFDDDDSLHSIQALKSKIKPKSRLSADDKLRTLFGSVRPDPLVVFVSGDGSPESPAVRPLHPGHVRPAALKRAAASYLASVVELDEEACIVTYPTPVEKFRNHLAHTEDFGFVETLRKLAVGTPLQKKLNNLQRRSAESNLDIIAVVRGDHCSTSSRTRFSLSGNHNDVGY